jgi:hypothetical protein
LNLSLRCIKHIIKEASSTRFMGKPYNTQTWEPIVYSRKENRQRAQSELTEIIETIRNQQTTDIHRHGTVQASRSDPNL